MHYLHGCFSYMAAVLEAVYYMQLGMGERELFGIHG
jgi:hypothetical protein